MKAHNKHVVKHQCERYSSINMIPSFLLTMSTDSVDTSGALFSARRDPKAGDNMRPLSAALIGETPRPAAMRTPYRTVSFTTPNDANAVQNSNLHARLL